MREKTQKGEITAFLSLLFLLMISLIGALIESASLQVLKNQKRADMNLAIESVFAEYNKEMLEEYDLFVLDASYGASKIREKKILDRLDYYGASGIENEISKMELLSDSSGKAFYVQVIRYMKNKTGLDCIESSDEKVLEWKAQNEEVQKYKEADKKMQDELESILEEAGESLPQEDNPIQSIEEIKQSNLLNVIVSDSGQLSKKNININKLPSGRSLHTGKGMFQTKAEVGDTIGKMFLSEYLMEHFTYGLETKTENALAYEVEYLLGGKKSDIQNLEIVVRRILDIRFALNYAYLLTDEVRKAEAKTWAKALCAFVPVPFLSEAATQAILAAWAYGESIVDLRALLDGEKVPVIKNTHNWYLKLSQLMRIKNKNIRRKNGTTDGGIGYSEYLEGFLLVEPEEILCIRALDLIESNLGIKMDHCVTQLEVESMCNLRRGVQYEFITYFGYQ